MDAAEYVQFDGTGLAELIGAGDVTEQEVVEAAIERIEELNPRLNAVTTRIDPAAQAGAPGAEGRLRGVPFLLKDLRASYAEVPTTAGSPFASAVPTSNSVVVDRYRAAGLRIPGKTNVPEMIFNLSGGPPASVPLVTNAAGLPIGVHIAGSFRDEATVLQSAAELERAHPWGVGPGNPGLRLLSA